MRSLYVDNTYVTFAVPYVRWSCLIRHVMQEQGLGTSLD
jgi:hypothetical protein